MGVLSKGQKVSHYTVGRKLGEGQFAEVWEVKDAAGNKVRARRCGERAAGAAPRRAGEAAGTPLKRAATSCLRTAPRGCCGAAALPAPSCT